MGARTIEGPLSSIDPKSERTEEGRRKDGCRTIVFHRVYVRNVSLSAKRKIPVLSGGEPMEGKRSRKRFPCTAGGWKPRGENAPWHGSVSGRSSRKYGDAGQERGLRQDRELHIGSGTMVSEIDWWFHRRGNRTSIRPRTGFHSVKGKGNIGNKSGGYLRPIFFHSCGWKNTASRFIDPVLFRVWGHTLVCFQLFIFDRRWF